MKRNTHQSALNIQTGILERYGLTIGWSEIETQIDDMDPGHDRILECYDLTNDIVEVSVIKTSSGSFMITLTNNLYCVGT